MTHCPVCRAPTPSDALAFLHERVHRAETEALPQSLRYELRKVPSSAYLGISEIMDAYAAKCVDAERERVAGADRVCPFCHESGFDDAGLKGHLLQQDCDAFRDIPALEKPRMF